MVVLSPPAACGTGLEEEAATRIDTRIPLRRKPGPYCPAPMRQNWPSMAEPKGSRRDYLTLQALDPKTREATAHVQISYQRMQTVGRRSLGYPKECGYFVLAILLDPSPTRPC